MNKTIKLLAAAIMMAMPLCSEAQLSELVEFPSPSTYKAYKTIVRNYNEYYDIIAVYGFDTTAYSTDTILTRTTFYKRKLATGEITRIFSMRNGYCVNDFRFVTLKRLGPNGIENYCCFCGTRLRAKGYWMVAPPGQPSQYVIDTVRNGFAGFFSMDEALWEDPGSTFKVRDIEGTEELYRMTCYPQQYGAFWQNQQTFRDNAVMDIIGKPKATETGGALSSLSRVRVYPIYPGGNNGTWWDVDIRYSDSTQVKEIMLDVTGTEEFTVTASQFDDNFKTLILRYSKKEAVYYANGLELSGTIYYLDVPRLYNDNFAARFELPVRLCTTAPGNDFAVAFRCPRFIPGVHTLQYRADNPGITCLRGIMNPGDIHLKDLAYLPLSGKTVLLAKHGVYSTESMLCIDNYPNPNNVSSTFLYENTLNLQSLVGSKRGSNDRMSFGGTYALHPCPAEIGSQIEMLSYDETNSCLRNVLGSDYWNSLDLTDSELEFNIKMRWQGLIPVEVFEFGIEKVDKKIECIKNIQ